MNGVCLRVAHRRDNIVYRPHFCGLGRKKGNNVAKQPAKGRKAPVKLQEATQNSLKAGESDGGKPPKADVIPEEVHKKTPSAAPKANASVPDIEKPKIEKPQPTPQESTTAAPAPAAQRSSFIPLVIGGLIAGVIGFVVATVTGPQTDNGLQDQVAQHAATISMLEQQVANPAVVDLTDIETQQTTLQSGLDQLGGQLTSLDDQLTALENLPRGEGTASVPALATYEAELEALRGQISEMTGIAQTQLDAARSEAAAIEENADAAARAAAGRAALSRLQTGLESGAPLGAALADLEGAIGSAAPDALIAVQDGVPTLASLQEQFPEIARAALATARSEGVAGEDSSGIGAFLRNQFDVRSVTPQEGTSADAVLSRAEGAVREGRLSDALAEISALPEVARAQMSDWLGQAETRADAIAAVDILSTSLSDN